MNAFYFPAKISHSELHLLLSYRYQTKSKERIHMASNLLYTVKQIAQQKRHDPLHATTSLTPLHCQRYTEN